MTAKSGSQAVERALRLLKLFSDQKSTLTVNEAVQATNLNRTTAHRILSALHNEGFLSRLPDGAYGLGAELTALGGYALRNNNLLQAARPIMEELRNEVNERVTLEVLSTSPSGAPAMLVMDEISAEHVLSVREFVGNHLPIHATSTGKVMLAFVSAEKRATLLDHTLKKMTDNTLNAGGISAEVAAIRKQGYAIAIEELEDGLIAIAAPLFDALGDPCGAISVAAPDVRISADRIPIIINALKAASQGISNRLGFRVRNV